MSGRLKGMRVIVTGGAGFIGSNLARQLLAEGAKVRLVDNLERGRLEYLAPIRDHVEFVEADLRDDAAARATVADADAVVHLAAKVGSIKVYTDRPGTVLHANLLIDQNVIRAALAAGIPRFVYASSTHVYPLRRQLTPDAPPLREEEADPAEPAITYGWGKRTGEITLQNLAAERPDFHVALPRIMGAFGYNQDFDLETGMAIPVFCHRACRWPELAPFRIWGSGRETRSFCFITDVVEALTRSVLALERTPVVGPFNLAAPGRMTIRAIAEAVIRISGKDIPLQFEPSAKTVLWGQAAEVDLARQLLSGWRAEVPMEEGLRRTYEDIARRLAERKGDGHVGT